MCDSHDVGTAIEAASQQRSNPESRIPNPDTDTVRVYLYDNYPGGIGFSAPLFQMHDELLVSTRRLIGECGCDNGCPGCVGPIGDTGPLAKTVALRILDLLLGNALPAAGDQVAEVQAF
jgi:ATP-dependent helicase YprA (DUF1998 family)